MSDDKVSAIETNNWTQCRMHKSFRKLLNCVARLMGEREVKTSKVGAREKRPYVATSRGPSCVWVKKEMLREEQDRGGSYRATQVYTTRN